ncbi:MAG: hypothetical protein ABSB26_08525 [Nitrososphaerales archaeon]
MGDSGFCDLVKLKRVGMEGMLLQITFWSGGVQLPYSSLLEVPSIRNLVTDEMPIDYLSAKVRPFSEDFKARLARSRNYG